MTGSGSPCGACKFLRRKCVRGCVFAPYFCHEQGATHFAAIHKVFGASNVSKLLAHLPVSDRCEAAVTISYEAQARLQDPIYGCVSHIFALQQQVVSLQAQLAYLKQLQAADQSFANVSDSANPNEEKYYGNLKPSHHQDLQGWFQSESTNMVPAAQLINPNIPEENVLMENSFGNYYGNSIIPEENASYATYEEASLDNMHINNRQWALQDAVGGDLESMAFSYIQHS